MPVRRKFKSKRTSTRHRSKVARKVREHTRKVSKGLIGPGGSKHKTRRDPGIPAILPGKDAFVARIHAEQEREREHKRLLAIKNNDVAGLVPVDAAPEIAVDEAPELAAAQPRAFFDASKRAFYREFQGVFDAADVILVVLDARDPQGCRVPALEQAVLASGGRKRLVLVLNKIDLVPRAVVSDWLRVLRREFPAVAFKASTQVQRSGLAASRSRVDKALDSSSAGSVGAGSECLGAETLLQLLKNYSRSLNIKTSVAVGVVGYPNVGKSSIINSLKRARVCRVGAVSGVTTSSQEVHLDRNIRLIDCPGVVFAQGEAADCTALMLRNCLRVEQIADPSVPVSAILERASVEGMMALYAIPRFATTAEFLGHVAQRQGKLRRGAVPDTEAAARAVMHDWNTGRIPFYTLPPALPRDADTAAVGAATLVAEWAPAFDLESLGRMETDDLALVPENISHATPIVMQVEDAGSALSVDSGATSAGSAQQRLVVDLSSVHARDASSASSDTDDGYEVRLSPAEAALNPQTNRDRARALKAARKAASKLAAREDRAMADD